MPGVEPGDRAHHVTALPLSIWRPLGYLTARVFAWDGMDPVGNSRLSVYRARPPVAFRSRCAKIEQRPAVLRQTGLSTGFCESRRPVETSAVLPFVVSDFGCFRAVLFSRGSPVVSGSQHGEQRMRNRGTRRT